MRFATVIRTRLQGLLNRNSVAADLDFGVRQLRTNPSATIVAVLSLAIGIGANIAVFNLMQETFFRRLPVSEPGRLAFPYYNSTGGSVLGFSYPDYVDVARRTDVFQDLTAFVSGQAALRTGEQTERITIALTTDNYFKVLDSPLQSGRGFLPDDPDSVAIIGHNLWRTRFGSDPGVVGKTVEVSRSRLTIIGVAAPDFHGADRDEAIELWAPLESHNQLLPWGDDSTPAQVTARRFQNRGTEWLAIVGRLQPGVELSQARAVMGQMSASMLTEHRRKTSGWKIELASAEYGATNPGETAERKQMMYVYLAIGGLILLSASANVSSLMLGRLAARRQELGMRLALGARPSRVFRQLLTESVLLGLVGGVAGFVVSAWSPALIRWLDLSGPWQSDLQSFSVNLSVVLYSLGLSVSAGLLLGLIPALSGLKPNLLSGLNRTTTRQTGKTRMRDALVVFQLCISLVLLVASGLLLRSLNNWLGLNPEFNRPDLVLMSFDLGSKERHGELFQRQMLEQARRVSSVEAAALSTVLPMQLGRIRWGGSRVENQETTFSGNVVSPGYFETMRVPILLGRDFSDADGDASKPVLVISDTVAKRFWPGQNPVGREITLARKSRTIVGVVADSRHYDIRSLTSQTLFVFLPLAQNHAPTAHLIVRSPEQTAIVPALRRAVAGVDPSLVPVESRTAAQYIHQTFAEQRSAASVTGVLAAMALILAFSGLYGVVSANVTERTREIGVRIALGARRAQVVSLVLGRVLVLAVLGIVMGLLVSSLATKAISSLLFGVVTGDRFTLILASVGLLTLAMGAAIGPARRAASVDPLTALRQD